MKFGIFVGVASAQTDTVLSSFEQYLLREVPLIYAHDAGSIYHNAVGALVEVTSVDSITAENAARARVAQFNRHVNGEDATSAGITTETSSNLYTCGVRAFELFVEPTASDATSSANFGLTTPMSVDRSNRVGTDTYVASTVATSPVTVDITFDDTSVSLQTFISDLGSVDELVILHFPWMVTAEFTSTTDPFGNLQTALEADDILVIDGISNPEKCSTAGSSDSYGLENTLETLQGASSTNIVAVFGCLPSSRAPDSVSRTTQHFSENTLFPGVEDFTFQQDYNLGQNADASSSGLTFRAKNVVNRALSMAQAYPSQPYVASLAFEYGVSAIESIYKYYVTSNNPQIFNTGVYTDSTLLSVDSFTAASYFDEYTYLNFIGTHYSCRFGGDLADSLEAHWTISTSSTVLPTTVTSMTTGLTISGLVLLVVLGVH